MNDQETVRSAKHELLEYLQTTLLKLGCIRFQGNEAPHPDARDMTAWAIVLYEQSADLHRQVFDDAASTANELRLSRQCLNSQLTGLLALEAILPEEA
jgi:hypothetical protein